MAADPIRRLSFDIAALQAAYRGGLAPAEVIAEAHRRLAAAEDPAIFISLRPQAAAMAEAAALPAFDPVALPLWGIPFAVKDNIDVAGLPTTAACPAFAYHPGADAFAVARLRAAGAIPIGKTNLDQFATGLVGVRSPYGAPRNALDPAIVPGGSSSGSAVAVARGIVSFALGTDTAGSGRVPAGLNNIVGLKPTLGALSARGVVPACRTLDTISLFALTVGDAWAALRAAAGYDHADPFSRHWSFAPLGAPPPLPVVAVPDAASREFFGDAVQAEIVRDDREQTNVLVLAGPGSGKTRVLVHRIAYLIRVKREDPRGILVLTYNRHAATEIRERLRRLIGDDAAGVTVSTCHALAMRLMGASFAGDHEGPRDFDGIVMQAGALLRGDGLSKTEAEALRETLIQGYRWLLVDEYQDIGPEEYALIGPVAGRSLEDDLRISLFAVGDDDQNIYAFAGASIDFIRRFEADYAAKPVWLTENYRSSANIIAAANAVIAPAAQRMKAGHDITVNRARAKAMPGGDWTSKDSVAQGRVTLMDAGGDAAQAVAALDELQRLSRLDPDWSWRRCAVIAREWRRLEPVRAYAEALGIPIDMANEKPLTLWRVREMQGFVRALLADRTRLLTISDLVAILNAQPQSRWTDLIGEGIGTLARELVEKAAPVPDIVQWFGEWARDARGEQRGLLLMTAHRAKGLEFDHVAILNGGWDRPSRGEDADAPRRLFYVAMTRARSTLTILTDGRHAFVQPGDAVLSRRVTPDTAALPRARLRYVPPDPKLVDLSFAGRLRPGDPSLAAIAAARPGDPVHLIRDGDRWRIDNAQGQTLARLSRAFAPPEGTTFLRGEVAAILNWRREDGDEDYHHLLRRDEWEVVLPELVFEAGAESDRAGHRDR